MPKNLKTIGLTLIILGALTAGGCHDPSYVPHVDDPSAQHPYSADIGSQIEVRKNIQFADIPAPQEFSLNKEETMTFQGSSMRFGTLVYAGIWNVWETNQWYLNAMEEAGWKLIHSKFINDYNVENFFKKGRETVFLTIVDNMNGLTVVTAKLNDEDSEERLKDKLLAKGNLLK